MIPILSIITVGIIYATLETLYENDWSWKKVWREN